MTKEEVEQAFNGASPYYAYKQGIQDGIAYNEESFRREAAKDILAGAITWGKVYAGSDKAGIVKFALDYTDELINQLKEDQA